MTEEIEFLKKCISFRNGFRFHTKRSPFPYKTQRQLGFLEAKMHIVANRHAVEVLLFKGKKAISVNRYVAQSPMFYRQFRKKYEQ